MTSTISAFTPAPIGAGGGIDRRGSRGRTRRRCKAFIPFLTLRTVSGKIITRANRDRRPDPKSLFGRLRVIDGWPNRLLAFAIIAMFHISSAHIPNRDLVRRPCNLRAPPGRSLLVRKSVGWGKSM